MRESPTRLGSWIRAAALGAALLLAACQPEGLNTTGRTASPNVDGVSYSLFFNQGQHVDQLARANRFEDVSRVFGRHREFFDTARFERHRPALTQSAEALNAQRRTEIADSLAAIAAADPGQVGQWPALRAAMARGDKAVADYDAVALLSVSAFRDTDVDRLRETMATLNSRLLEGAAAAYQAYDHFNAESFFAVYPATLEAKSFKATNLDSIEPRLRAVAQDRLIHFATVSRAAGALDEATSERIANMILASHFRGAGGPPRDLRTLLAGLSAVRAAGFEPKKVEGLRVGFAQATSQTLLRTGAIEFPAEVDIDLPFEATKIDLDRAIEDPIAQTADFLIVFDVALARNNRRVAGMDPIRSRAVVGTRREPNPAFAIRQNELNLAQMAFQSNQSQANMNSLMNRNATGLGALAATFGGLADSMAVSESRNRVQQAMDNLRQTPQMIDVPVFQDYAYNQARVQASRAMTVNYYVIDRRAQTYFKSTFDVTENQEFRVNYNVENTDPMAAQIRASAHKEDDVTEWEQAPMKVKLSQLVDHYLKNPAREQRLPTLIALREEMLRDKNTAIASFRANRVEDSRRTDHRMESVVAIHMGSGGLGSGFYITPDLVLTNYHVVGQGRLAELRLSNGQETFGRVEASDVRLDLALIRTQNRGKPVQFFEGNRLDLGSQIEVIGHPRGAMFSLTRGVVSAVRQSRSPNNIPGPNYWQVQFDAASSPGNSGGPVFLGDRVIAVLSHGIRGGENLNFGTHYREVLDWLKEKNVQVVTQR